MSISTFRILMIRSDEEIRRFMQNETYIEMSISTYEYE